MSELKPMFDNFVSALSSQFRQQYPQGSIISDLVQIHGDQYVVKVSILVESTTLVSTLAADANLLVAESQAMTRALTILGIQDLRQPADEPVSLVEEKVSLPPVLAVTAAAPISTQVTTTSEISEQPLKSDPEPSFFAPTVDFNIPVTNGKIATDLAPASLPEIPTETASEPAAQAEKNSRTKKSAPASDFLSATTVEELPLDQATEPIAEPALSVTDMIPMINMELKRLGWSKERGREYMVSLYNKRASALLSDDELLGLLQHLQAEPIV